MSVAGRKVYSELQRQAEKARARAADVAVEVGRVRARVSELVEQRGRAVVDLAEEMLPELSDQAIRRTFDGIRDQLVEILQRRERRIDELHRLISSQETEIRQLDAQIEAAVASLASANEELEGLEQTATERLAADPEFVELSKAAAFAEERLARNEERVAEIRREAKEKLPGYQRSRLFMYLVDRDFGAPAYRSRGLVRRLDRWVAGLVDFPAAKRGYDFLRVTPELVEAEVERRRAEFDALMQRIEEIESDVAAEIGLTDCRVRVEQLDAEDDRLIEARERAEATRVANTDELAAIQRREGPFQAEAMTRFRAFLGDTRTLVLERHARKTPESADDRLVAQIDRVDEALDDLEPELDALVRDHDAREDHARELGRVAQRFRSAGYHRSDSYLEDDLRRDVERVGVGDLDSADLWHRFERGHRRRRRDFGGGIAGGAGSFGGGIGDILSHPVTNVLINAMGHVVGSALGGALSGAARRGVGRRHGGSSGGSIAGSIFRGGGGGGSSSGGSSGGSRGGFSVGDSF